jgi:hypothetical protein
MNIKSFLSRRKVEKLFKNLPKTRRVLLNQLEKKPEDFITYTEKICSLEFAEAKASDHVMRNNWRRMIDDLSAKRKDWLERKCQGFKRTKAE